MQSNVDLALSQSSLYDDAYDELQYLAMACLSSSSSSSSSSLSSVSTLEELNHESSYQCAVCFENTANELDRRQCCDLPLCQACLEMYIRAKLSIGVVHIGCPNPLCKRLVQVGELASLEHELVQLFYRRLVDANSDPHRKTCPNCCLVTEGEPQSNLNDQKATEYGLLISCTMCQFEWCFRCHGPQHHGVKCDENGTGDNLLQQWAQSDQTSDIPTAQQCPTCKIYVERISGCPHMECRMCASEFCYYCGDRWDDEHLLSCVKAVDEDGRRPVLDLDEIREFRMARRRQRGRRIRKKLKRGGIIGGVVVGGVLAVPVVVALVVPVAAVAVSTYAGYLLTRRIKRVVRRASRSS